MVPPVKTDTDADTNGSGFHSAARVGCCTASIQSSQKRCALLTQSSFCRYSDAGSSLNIPVTRLLVCEVRVTNDTNVIHSRAP